MLALSALPTSRLVSLVWGLVAPMAFAAEPCAPDPDPEGDGRVTCPDPQYPHAAIGARAQGTTAVRLTFRPDGKVAEATVVCRSGDTPSHRKLDAAAVKALKRCRLEGATPGQPAAFVRTVDWDVEVAAPAASAVGPGNTLTFGR